MEDLEKMLAVMTLDSLSCQNRKFAEVMGLEIFYKITAINTYSFDRCLNFLPIKPLNYNNKR